MSNEQKTIPEITMDGNDVIIRLKQEGMVWITEHRPDGTYKVLDKDQFMKDLKFQLEEYQSQNDVETGLTALQTLLDNCVAEVVVNNESIEYKDDSYDSWITK